MRLVIWIELEALSALAKSGDSNAEVKGCAEFSFRLVDLMKLACGHKQRSCELVCKELMEVVVRRGTVVHERVVTVPRVLTSFDQVANFVGKCEALTLYWLIDVDEYLRSGQFLLNNEARELFPIGRKKTWASYKEAIRSKSSNPSESTGMCARIFRALPRAACQTSMSPPFLPLILPVFDSQT